MLLADVCWPALFLSNSLYSILIIVVGFGLEYLLLLGQMRLPANRAFKAVLIMNAVSTALGIFGVPIVGLVLEIIGIVLEIGGGATFTPTKWVFTSILAALFNTIIELIVLRWFKDIKQCPKLWLAVLLGNCLSVGLAMWGLYRFPPEGMGPLP